MNFLPRRYVASQIYRTTIDFTIMIYFCVIVYFVQKSSQALSLVVGQQLKQYVKDDGVIRLLQSFLHTKWLIEKKESPMPLREDAQVLHIM